MKDIKKLMITLVALLAVTTGAWADNTVTWEGATLKSVNVASYENNKTQTIGDITVTANSGYFKDFGSGNNGVIASAYETNGLVFSANAKFKSVEVTASSSSTFNHTSGSATSHTYTVNPTATSFALPYGDGWINITKIVFTFEDAAASSGPEVDWNKTSKTGTFTMPGGNVELEPEYYPQAALATGGAPTAINDVPATTDGAIVEAGTVANIGETTTAQGTVMYYVSQTALDDAALLALAADAWTADVPTAESFTAAGTAHVYYYVRGNNSDNDDENFSDGDILATNALTVTIAAAPTYAVTFADGIDEPTEWTASPATNVTKGETVTVTYTGSKKVLGVKAEKKAPAVPKAAKDATAEDLGKLIGADGNIYDDAGAATAANTTAVAKIFYVGSDNGEDAPYNHGLALALSDASNGCYWSTSSTKIHTYNPQNQNFTSESGLQYNATHNSDDYPAFKAAITYSPAAPTGCSAWFLASGYQWKQMIGAAGLSNLGLTSSAYYWSSSEANLGSAWNLESTNGYWDFDAKGDDYRVRACLAF